MSAAPRIAISAPPPPPQVRHPAQTGTASHHAAQTGHHATAATRTAQTGHHATTAGTGQTGHTATQGQPGAGTAAGHTTPAPAPADAPSATPPPPPAAAPPAPPDTASVLAVTDSPYVDPGEAPRPWVWYGSIAALVLVCVVLATRLLRSPRKAVGNSDAHRRAREYRDTYERAAEREGPGDFGAALSTAGPGFGGRHRPRDGVATDSQLSAAITQIDERLNALTAVVETSQKRVDGRLETIQQQLEALADSQRGGSAPQPRSHIASGVDPYPLLDGDGRFGAGTMEGSGSPPDLVISHAVGGYGASSLAGSGAPAGNRVPVEINGDDVVVTHTIPPDAWLVPQGGGRASVWLNGEVEHNRYALDRFALFFKLGDRREGAYQTQTPADVDWDEGRQRGTLRTCGTAVAR